MSHPWEGLNADIPEPGEVRDLDCGVADMYGTDPDNPPVSDSVDDIDDYLDEVNEYDEADDEFEDDEEDES